MAPPYDPNAHECRDRDARARLDSLEGRMLAAESVGKQTLAETQAQTPVLRTLTETIGQSPDPAQGIRGSGMAGVVAELAIERDDKRKARKLLWGLVVAVSVLIGIVSGALATAAHLETMRESSPRKESAR